MAKGRVAPRKIRTEYLSPKQGVIAGTANRKKLIYGGGCDQKGKCNYRNCHHRSIAHRFMMIMGNCRDNETYFKTEFERYTSSDNINCGLLKGYERMLELYGKVLKNKKQKEMKGDIQDLSWDLFIHAYEYRKSKTDKGLPDGKIGYWDAYDFCLMNLAKGWGDKSVKAARKWVLEFTRRVIIMIYERKLK